jgi:hypothetical protein
MKQWYPSANSLRSLALSQSANHGEASRPTYFVNSMWSAAIPKALLDQRQEIRDKRTLLLSGQEFPQPGYCGV